MRVTLERKERTSGLLRKTTWHVVHVNVEFSNVELETIKKHKLGKVVVYQKPNDLRPDAEPWDIFIEDLVKANGAAHAAFPTPIQASNFENELKTSILPKLKSYIEGNQSTGPKSETLEF